MVARQFSKPPHFLFDPTRWMDRGAGGALRLSAAWSAGAAWSESLRRCGLDPEIKPEVIPSPSHPAARPCVVASGRLALEGVRSGLGGQPPSGGFGGGLASCVRKLWRPRVLDSTSSFSRWLAPTAGVFLPVCVLCDALRHELGPPHEEGFPVPVDEVAAVHGLASVEPPAPRCVSAETPPIHSRSGGDPPNP